MSVGSVGGGEAKGGLVYEGPMLNAKHAASSAPAGPPAKSAAPPPLVSKAPQGAPKGDKNRGLMA